jgi:hypothetical protein
MEPEEPQDASEFRRDRRLHGGGYGGSQDQLNDDQLAELTEEERVDLGLDAYDPDEVPPATDPLPPGVPPLKPDIRDSPVYQAEQEEIRRQAAEGDFDDSEFPPTRYDDE